MVRLRFSIEILANARGEQSAKEEDEEEGCAAVRERNRRR